MMVIIALGLDGRGGGNDFESVKYVGKVFEVECGNDLSSAARNAVNS